MKRFIDKYLLDWKHDRYRKSLLLRGARQVGKTYAVRQLAKQYINFVEINFENLPEAINIFELDLQPERIISELSALISKSIKPDNTLLFFDEIQACPKAIIALRYFYEKMPELHVIGAGSLLDFAIQQVGVPVGRVSFLYMYPLSFIEFLYAVEGEFITQEILNTSIEKPLSIIIHEKILRSVAHYLAIGGMPEAVKTWRDTKDLLECTKVHNTIIDAYKFDFEKYAKKNQIKYLNLLLKYIPQRIGKKFKFSEVSTEYRKRELAPSLDLLDTAGIIHEIFHSAGQGIPLGAQSHLDDFKILFLDIAISQTLLGTELGPWIYNPLEQFINKGEIVEAFIGQELLAYSPHYKKAQLYYWHREVRGSQAEVDYIIQQKENIIPIEVKSGAGSTLKSMHLFLESHPQSPFGIRFSTQNYSKHEKIISYPLYAVASALHAAESVML